MGGIHFYVGISSGAFLISKNPVSQLGGLSLAGGDYVLSLDSHATDRPLDNCSEDPLEKWQSFGQFHRQQQLENATEYPLENATGKTVYHPYSIFTEPSIAHCPSSTIYNLRDAAEIGNASRSVSCFIIIIIIIIITPLSLYLSLSLYIYIYVYAYIYIYVYIQLMYIS